MSGAERKGVSRRNFLLGTGAGAAVLGLGLCQLRSRGPAPRVGPPLPAATPVEPIVYGNFTDLWRQRWTWDRVAKGTHTRANCIAACSWNVFVKDGIVWREEQDAVYDAPRPDVPDGNPRGCQKGACYTRSPDVALPAPAIRSSAVGERGAGNWKRISWDEALNEIADELIDAARGGGHRVDRARPRHHQRRLRARDGRRDALHRMPSAPP